MDDVGAVLALVAHHLTSLGTGQWTGYRQTELRPWRRQSEQLQVVGRHVVRGGAGVDGGPRKIGNQSFTTTTLAFCGPSVEYCFNFSSRTRPLSLLLASNFGLRLFNNYSVYKKIDESAKRL